MTHRSADPARRQLLRQGLCGGALGVSALAGVPWLGGCAALAPVGPAGPMAGRPAADWQRPAMPALSPTQQWRLLERLTWGAQGEAWQRLQALGPQAYVAEQLRAEGPDRLPPPVQAQIDAMATGRRPLPELMAEAEATRRQGDERLNPGLGPDQRAAAQRAYQAQLTGWARDAAARHLWRALYSPHQLHAQMVWFWMNHFSVYQFKGSLRAMVGDLEERAVRPHALGRFRDLLGAVVRHPAMLQYLDNAQSSAGRLNENLARELLELHTLGVDGGYSQDDVLSLARVLSGHGSNFSGQPPRLRPALQPLLVQHQGYEFNPARHDAGPKRLLGQAFEGAGADELDRVLDLLATHPATARHLCRRMAMFFLGEGAGPELVARMAAAFTAHDGEVGAALAVLVADPAFVAEGPADQATPFKDPMHYLVSAVRACWPASQPVLNTAPMQNWLNRLGQGLYNRVTPDGYPLQGEPWRGSGQMALRFELARTLAGGAPALFRPEPPPAAAPVAGTAPATAPAAGAAPAMAPVAAATSAPGAAAGGAVGAGRPATAGQPGRPAQMAAVTGAAAAGLTPPTPPAQPLADPALRALVLAGWQPATRQVLAAANAPVTWATLMLSSPDFMRR